MSASICKDLKAIHSIKKAERRECAECIKTGAWWGSPQNLPGMWRDAVL